MPFRLRFPFSNRNLRGGLPSIVGGPKLPLRVTVSVFFTKKSEDGVSSDFCYRKNELC